MVKRRGTTTASLAKSSRGGGALALKKNFFHYYELYLLIIPVLLFYIIFAYGPMWGAQIAFRKYSPRQGMWNSPWIGLTHFKSFFSTYYAWRLIRNTLLMNVYGVLFNFPSPIILALLINELRSRRYKRVVQTITYMPHFISVVIICALLTDMLSLKGWFNSILVSFGAIPHSFLTDAGAFRTIFISSNIYQHIGWNSIVYLSAISNIDPQLYEAATIDGAGRFRKALSVTLPSMAPIIITMFILRIGSMMTVGYEKVLLLYNPATYETADMISTFVYRKGLLEANYSYSTAIGLMNSLVNFLLLITANFISRKVSETSLF
ncbi:sugar ABC transporter permease [Clostridia bacterium]|nr:sugar ABC transporter permease [Clostridia bacterium]